MLSLEDCKTVSNHKTRATKSELHLPYVLLSLPGTLSFPGFVDTLKNLQVQNLTNFCLLQNETETAHGITIPAHQDFVDFDMILSFAVPDSIFNRFC